MSALDFKEIPVPTAGSGRDQFEMFARDFLDMLGFRVVTGPDRGADGGRDLIVEEARTGITGDSKIRWLVSCKHKAHSGASVNPDDESDIRDRLQTHDCQGFMGFYSTLPSSGLAQKLNAQGLPYEVQVFDGARIESLLLKSPAGIALSRRYMSASTSNWSREHPAPARLFREDPELLCEYCQKSLLHPVPSGIIVLWCSHNDDYSERRVEKVYWCCKGGCDRVLTDKHYRKGLVDGWEDIPDIIAPVGYLRWFIAIINELHSSRSYSPAALERSKTFLINLFPLVAREMTAAEKDRIGSLGVIPAALGGWGE